jgi:hypothetical protein
VSASGERRLRQRACSPTIECVCGCLVIFLGAFFPRFTIVMIELFTDLNDRAFESFWVGFLGFLFLPYTTLAYVLMNNWQDGVRGFGWFLVVLGFVFDLSSYTGSARARTAS